MPTDPISDARRGANRRNAARSTGPRTAEGKARSSQNALRHGASSVVRHPEIDGPTLAEVEPLAIRFREAGVEPAAAVVAARAQIALQRIGNHRLAIIQAAQAAQAAQAERLGPPADPATKSMSEVAGSLALTDVAQKLLRLNDVERRIFALRRKALARRS